MASSKKINFNVDTKTIIKRKRRKSDLVIMWQSFYDVTSSIILEFWSMIIKVWHITRLWFDSSERLVIQTWLEKYIPWAPTDYAESWRDGCLLSVLLNKLHPGCLPDAEKLDSEYSLRNVYHAFDVLEEYFDIKPDLTPEEIVTCANGSEKKFYELLSQLKQTTEVKNDTDETIPKTEILEETESDINALNKHCIAKGTGLVVGFVQRMTHFIVFYANLADLDVVVDIKGPSDTVCCERITKRSPKKRYSSPDIMDYPFSHISRSVSNPEDKISYDEEESDFINKIIPLDYEILPNQINFAYKPLCKGQHKISVLWHGLHVSDSPYTVTVEDSCQINNINHSVHIKPALKGSHTPDKPESKKPSVRFQDSKESKERCGKTLKKRVLRYIVKIDGKDVAVDTNSTDSLATELLKMDYDYDNSLSLGRRNSWGFTGDAERKVSVIRQFCVDVDVMEAQSKHKRSKSLVGGNESINGLSKSDSFNDLKLSCITENAVKNVHDFYASDDTLPHTDFDSNENLLEDLEREMDNPDSTALESSFFDERQANSKKVEVLENPVIKSCYGEESKTENSRLISSLSAEKLPPSAENLNDDLMKSSDILCDNIDSHLTNNNKRDLESKSDGSKQISLKMVDDSPARKTGSKSTKIPVFVKRKPALRNATSNKKLLKPQSHVKSKNTKKNKFDKTDKKVARLDEKEMIDRLSVSSNGSHSVKIKKYEDLNNKERYNIKTKGNVIHSKEKPWQSEIVNDEAVNFNHYNILPSQIYTIQNVNGISQDINCVSQYNGTLQSIQQKSSGSPEYISPKVKGPLSSPSHNFSSKGTKSKTKLETRATSLPEYDKLENKISDKELSQNLATSSKHRSSNNIIDNEQTRPIKTHSLLSIGHFNFKQFNPSSENASSFRVKNRISEWEATISGENKNFKISKNSVSAEISETIDVKAKLSFWENAYKKEDESSYIYRGIGTAMDRLALTDSLSSDHSKNISDEIPFGNTGKQKKRMDATILTTAKTNSFFNTIPNKKTADKCNDPVLGPSNKQTRSFSDPVIDTKKRTEEVNFDSSFEISGNIYSSNEIDLAIYSSDDESSAPDHLKLSTEDEYIDDEISESTSMFWGELSLLKNQINSNTSSDAECSDFLDPDYFRQRYLSSNFCPSECKIFGIANYYGYVALKNRFQVLTKDAGTGNLSASVQGFGQHDVSLVSVVYVRKDVYDVTYQVMTAGYYLISVRWMDNHIPGSPFVCKVTF